MEERKVLDSWKEIASYLNRSVKTCHRFEQELGLPVHRLEDSPSARVFAYKDEIDRWKNEILKSRGVSIEEIPTTEKAVPQEEALTSRAIGAASRLRKLFILTLVILAIPVISIIIWQLLSQKEAVALHSDKPSIAVLPFVDLSPESDQGYFCDGMTDEIISKLSRFKGWKVTPRTSMMRYKNTNKDIKEIGKELDVANILEGSFKKESDDIRININLIRIEDSIQLWSDTYEKKLESIFAIQSDIAERIANALEVELSLAEKKELARKPTENLIAYDYYLRGREYYSRYRKQDNERAIELFKKALELDPNYALAYSGLGDSYGQKTNQFGFPDVWLDESIKVSKKAISLDPNLSEGYKALGVAYIVKGWIRKAIEANRKAIKLNPNNEGAMLNLGAAYWVIGEFEKSIKCQTESNLLLARFFPHFYIHMGQIYRGLDDLARAEHWLSKVFELRPHNYDANKELIICHLTQGKFLQAAEQSQKWLSMVPDNPVVQEYAGLVELHSGNYEQAQQYYKNSIEILTTHSNLTGLGYTYWKKGNIDEAWKLFNQSSLLCQRLLKHGNEHWEVPYTIAAIHAVQGNKEESYKSLQKAIDAGWRFFRWSLRDPMLENLHEDEKFKKMIEKVKAKVYEMRKRMKWIINNSKSHEALKQ